MLKYLIVNCQNCTDHQLEQSEDHRRVDESLLRVYLLGPGPHLPPLSLQPPHSLLSPLSPHFKTTYFCKRSILKHSDQYFLFSTQLITIIRKHKVSAWAISTWILTSSSSSFSSASASSSSSTWLSWCQVSKSGISYFYKFYTRIRKSCFKHRLDITPQVCMTEWSLITTTPAEDLGGALDELTVLL